MRYQLPSVALWTRVHDGDGSGTVGGPLRLLGDALGVGARVTVLTAILARATVLAVRVGVAVLAPCAAEGAGLALDELDVPVTSYA